MIRVLVIDDEERFRRLLTNELSRKGFSVEAVPDGNEALGILKEKSFDVILLDIVMPGIDGISLMKELATSPESPVIIVLTGKATVETAVEAMKSGAYDYLTKPYKLDELVIIINRAFDYGNIRKKNLLLQQELVRKETPSGLVAESAGMESILDLVRKIAPTDSPVLIQGESGTGKELIANTIWQHSNRNEEPFVALNCATLTENFLESELFGYEKGAHSTAYQTKHGLVEVADGGTLFLDEIAEIPLGLQAKLLRFLDSGEFRRLGGNKTLSVDVRVITATNSVLGEAVKAGTFREDLFFRLNVINIVIPPLRERSEDIPVLCDFFLKKYGQKLAKPVTAVSSEVIGLFLGYDWPGNVRELENVMERAVIISDSPSLTLKDVSIPASFSSASNASTLSLNDLEKDHIIRVLRQHDGNQSKASQALGIDRKTLYLKLRKYGISQS